MSSREVKRIGCFNIKLNYVKKYNKDFSGKYKFIIFKGDGGAINKRDHLWKEKYSLTPPKEARFLARHILEKHTKDSLIVDATTSIGGNFLYFLECFDILIGTEINMVRFNKLVNSIERRNIALKKKKNMVFSQGKKKLILINDSFVTYIDYILQRSLRFNKTVIFFDPPWGGKGYKDFHFVLLGLHGIPLHILINKILVFSKNIRVIAKLPKNYYFGSFTSKFVKIDMGNFYYVEF